MVSKRREDNKCESLFLWYLAVTELDILVDRSMNISLVLGMRLKCVFILPLLVASLQAASVDDLTFALNGDGTEYSVTTCYRNASGSLDIPSTYNGLPVTSIGYMAFSTRVFLTSINIPNSVTSIGWGAFLNCTGLSSITIPDSVTSIGGAAFVSCAGLTSITIPDGVTSIEDATFRDCGGLNSIVIPNSVTSIGDYAFEWCNLLTNITFEGDAPTFGTDVFQYSNSVTIYYYDDATGFTSPTWQGIQSEAIPRPAPIVAVIEKSVMEFGVVHLWFNSASGQSYRIESSTDLESWTTLEDEIISEGNYVVRNYDTVGIQKRFYRVKRND
jgi:hypothetical protein